MTFPSLLYEDASAVFKMLEIKKLFQPYVRSNASFTVEHEFVLAAGVLKDRLDFIQGDHV